MTHGSTALLSRMYINLAKIKDYAKEHNMENTKSPQIQ